MGDLVNLKKDFTEPECERFRMLCNFTQDERAVFDMRVKAKSIVEIQIALCMSDSTIRRRLRNIEKKISKVV